MLEPVYAERDSFGMALKRDVLRIVGNCKMQTELLLMEHVVAEIYTYIITALTYVRQCV